MEEMSLEQGLEEIGHKILVLTRNELYMKMRFMDVALSAFYYVQDFSVDLLATDGETMYFNGQMLGGEYRQNRIEVTAPIYIWFCTAFSDMYFAEMDGKSLYGTWRRILR